MTPEEVVQRAFQALRARDGAALASIASARSLEDYVENVRREVRPEWVVWTADMVLAHNPGMPREAAQWQVSEMELHRATHAEKLLAQFADVQTIEELTRMGGEELLSRALRAAPDPAVAMAQCRVLGHVQERDRAYVLFWFGDDNEQDLFSGPQIATVDCSDGSWKLVLDIHTRWGLPGYRNMMWIDETFHEPSE